MRPAIQYLLVAAYTVVPVATIFWALLRRRRGHVGPLVNVIFSYLAATGIAVVVLLVNARLLGGAISTAEQMRLVYLVIGAVCVLKLIDRTLIWLLFHALRIPRDPAGRPTARRLHALLGLLAERAVMIVLVISYALGLLMVYRPKAVVPGTPAQLKLDYANVAFAASDGVGLRGWWIRPRELPDSVADDDESAESWGRRTVILCHGAGAGKEHQLGLAWLLAQRGFHVLLFDFRGHGRSDGNFITFGDLERRDVLAAIRWVRANHPDAADHLFGVGVNAGAAALLAAAADRADGQALDALVLYEPFARFDAMAAETAGRMLPAPLAWMVRHIGVPLASLHAGSDLASFAPADYAPSVWPRPVLLVHGRGIGFVPTLQEMELFQQLPYPKEEFWPADNYQAMRKTLRRHQNDSATLLVHAVRHWMGTRQNITADPGAQLRMLRFLDAAHPRPTI